MAHVYKKVARKSGMCQINFLKKMNSSYNQLVEDRALLLAEKPYLPESDRMGMASLMFEKFHVPSYLSATQGALALLPLGLKSGISVDIGDQATQIIPIYEGK